jgi:hypothetical protein
LAATATSGLAETAVLLRIGDAIPASETTLGATCVTALAELLFANLTSAREKHSDSGTTDLPQYFNMHNLYHFNICK